MGVSSELLACTRNECLLSYRRPSVEADAWVCGLQGTSVPDEAIQVFYEYRIHSLELEEERSRSCQAIPRKPGAILTFGSRLRSYTSRVRQLQSATPLLEDPASADRKSTRLNSSHRCISYAVFCL